MTTMSSDPTPARTAFTYAWYKEAEYAMRTRSYLTLGTGKANETQTEEIWTLQPGEFNQLDLNISPKVYPQFDRQMKPFYDLLHSIEAVTRHLELQLGPDKTVSGIRNQEEIWHKWESVKEKEFKFLELINQNNKQVIDKYDQEIAQTGENLQHSLMYQLMFYPFSEDQPQSGPFAARETPSVLFPGELLTYASGYEINEAAAGYEMKVKGAAETVPPQFAKRYEQEYKEMLNLPLEYDFSLEGSYSFNGESVLAEAVFHVKERLNDLMFYVCEYHIELLK